MNDIKERLLTLALLCHGDADRIKELEGICFSYADKNERLYDRIEMLEAELVKTQAHLAMRNSDLDENRRELAEAQEQLAVARSALEKVTGVCEFDLADLEGVAPDQTPEEYVCEQALAKLQQKDPS